MGMYKSAYTGTQIDDAVGKALNPDTTPTVGSKSLLTSGGAATSLSHITDSGYGGTTQAVFTINDSTGALFEQQLDALLVKMEIGDAKQIRFSDHPVHLGYPAIGTLSIVDGNQAVLYGTSCNGSQIVKVKLNSVWQPWEWVNPPMATGIEYRTIERYNGKPVYKKLLEIHGLPSAIGSELSVEFVAGNVFDKAVSLNAWMTYFGVSLPYRGVADVKINSNTIVITAERDLSLTTALVSVSYAKK